MGRECSASDGGVSQGCRGELSGSAESMLDELATEFQPKVVAAFRSRAAAVCREHFSHEEVRQLIQFYETPVGRKYARAFTEIVDKMRAYDPQRKVVMDELVSRIRKQGKEPRNSKGE